MYRHLLQVLYIERKYNCLTYMYDVRHHTSGISKIWKLPLKQCSEQGASYIKTFHKKKINRCKFKVSIFIFTIGGNVIWIIMNNSKQAFSVKGRLVMHVWNPDLKWICHIWTVVRKREGGGRGLVGHRNKLLYIVYKGTM